MFSCHPRIRQWYHLISRWITPCLSSSRSRGSSRPLSANRWTTRRTNGDSLGSRSTRTLRPRERRGEVEILDVCLWSRIKKSTGIASIMLLTINLALFIETRHRIRMYTAYSGYWRRTKNQNSWTGTDYQCTFQGITQTFPRPGC